MTIPKQLIDLAKHFEGFHREICVDGVRMAKPYICPAGYWTIGYGHLCAQNDPPITEAQAEIHLVDDLRIGMAAAMRYCPVLLNESAERVSAIADFAFNLGAGALQTSTLRRYVNNRDWTGAGEQLLRWVHGGGRVLPGLVRRRQAEKELLVGGEI